MAVAPAAPGAGHTGPRALTRPEAAPAPVGVDAAEAELRTAEAAAAPGGSTAPDQQGSPSGIPRWLLLLVGVAAATVAVAGLRAVAWLVAPVFLALVVVVA